MSEIIMLKLIVLTGIWIIGWMYFFMNYTWISYSDRHWFYVKGLKGHLFHTLLRDVITWLPIIVWVLWFLLFWW